MSNLSTKCGKIKKTTIMDISPNTTDSEDEELSNEELSSKIKLFCNLSTKNKINTSNAFDLNMVGYLYKWLEKKKHENNFDFYELADYLDTTRKIYCYRIENANENLNKLTHEIRNKHYKNSTIQQLVNDEGKMLKRGKPLRSKLMLTTADKLPNKSSGICLNNVNSKFTFQELFKTSRPANYILSMYYDIPLETELMQIKEDKVENRKNNKYKIKNITNEISKSLICSEFFEFVAEKDKKSNYDNENFELENIEDYFLCETKPCQTFKVNYNSTELNADNECYNEITSNDISINDDNLMDVDDNIVTTDDTLINNDDELNKQQNIKISTSDSIDEIEIDKKKKKKRLNKSEDVKEIKWLKMSEIEPILKKMHIGNQQIPGLVINKLNPQNNRAKPSPSQYVYKFTYLEYMTKQLNLTTSQTCEINKPYEGSSEYTPNETTDNLNNSVLEDNPNNSINNFMNISQKDNCHDDSENKHLNIFELKNKIMKIINRECVILRPNYKWTNNLAFSDLLTQLDKNDEWSVASVYVGLLHLTNEVGLRLFPGYNSVTNLQEIYIAKPANKCNT